MVRAALVTARWALRTYWRSAAVLALAVALGLCAVLTVASWVLPHYPALAPRFGLAPIPAWDAARPWNDFARAPTGLQWDAMIGLFQTLVGQTAALVVVAVLTVIGVSVARSRGRAGEVAVRRAVGAMRRTVVLSALSEIGVVAGIALAIGGFAAVAWSRAALREWHGVLWPAAATPVLAVAVSALFVLAVDAALTAAPAWRQVLAPPLSTTPGLAVAALQLGLSLIGLAAGDVFAHRLDAMQEASATGAGTGAMFQLSAPALAPAARAEAYARIMNSLADSGAEASLESPATRIGLGVTDVAVADCGRCWWAGNWSSVYPTAAQHFLVSADSFRMLGVPVLQGRGISDRDRFGAEPVAVISRSLEALRFQRPAVGRKIRVGGAGPARWYTVVGVVGDRVPDAFGGAGVTREAVYLSALQHPAERLELLVRSNHGTAAALPAASAGLAVRYAGSERDLIGTQEDPLRWFRPVFATQGWLMLLLAWLGTTALMLIWVHSIRHELGIRRAVGATRSRVIGYVLARALVVAAAGVIIARWLGDLVWTGITAVVPGVPDLSWDTVLRLSALLAVSAVTAALVPAWRAARVAPAALSQEE